MIKRRPSSPLTVSEGGFFRGPVAVLHMDTADDG